MTRRKHASSTWNRGGKILFNAWTRALASEPRCSPWRMMRVLGIGCRRIPTIPDRGCDQVLHDHPEARTELLSSGNGSHVLGERRLDFAIGTHLALTSGPHIVPSHLARRRRATCFPASQPSFAAAKALHVHVWVTRLETLTRQQRSSSGSRQHKHW